MTEADHVARLLEAGRRAVDPKHRADPGEVGLRKGWAAGEKEKGPQFDLEAPPSAEKGVEASPVRVSPQHAS